MTDFPDIPADALADENGLAAVPAISAAFDELVLAYKKEVYVTIVTAHVSAKSAHVVICEGRTC